MKKYMPLNGLRWSRDSGSALCGTPPTDVLGQAGGECEGRCEGKSLALTLALTLEPPINRALEPHV